jgi:ABC-type uncharacterized transport system permease subunit
MMWMVVAETGDIFFLHQENLVLFLLAAVVFSVDVDVDVVVAVGHDIHDHSVVASDAPISVDDDVRVQVVAAANSIVILVVL